MENVTFHSVTLGDENAIVVVTKPSRGPTKVEHWFNGSPSKTFEVLLSSRRKINKLLKLK